MKLSLRIKVTLILTVSLALVIFLCWFLNQTFLDDYYQYSKRQSLSECYTKINDLAGAEGSSWNDEYTNYIERIEAIGNISVFLLEEGRDELGAYLKFIYPGALYLQETKTRKYDRVKNALFGYIFGAVGEGSVDFELLESELGKYDIYMINDKQVDSSYIDLVGYLDNGYLAFVRTNYESIQESAAISNKFLGFVGIFAVLLGAVVMLIFSKSFTRPIKELSVIAGRMSELDFDAKYTLDRNDEIGELGHSINVLSERLEHTISELKTANVELRRDNERKTQIDEMRKDFLSNVSHELKTPIALIQGYAEGLQENISDDQESREFYCEVIMDEARKMNKMVQKLLTLNQLEFGNNHTEFERFDIVELVRSVVGSAEIMLKQKNINLVLNECEPVFVWADQYMIEEVITNYLSNAINHIDGTRVIDVRFTVNPDDVRVSIFNTGKRIPDDELEKIWIKFYKVDKARTREYGGSGIGLSIVKAIMETHGRACGAINHEDGVEFWFDMDTSIDE